MGGINFFRAVQSSLHFLYTQIQIDYLQGVFYICNTMLATVTGRSGVFFRFETGFELLALDTTR